MVDLGVNWGCSHIADSVLNAYRDRIHRHVQDRVRQMVAANKHHLQLLLLYDHLVNQGMNEKQIYEAIGDILIENRSFLGDLSAAVVQSLTSSSHVVVKGVASAIKVDDAVKDLHKVLNFVDDFCDQLARRIRAIRDEAKGLDYVLRHNANSRALTDAEAQTVAQALKKHGFFVNGLPNAEKIAKQWPKELDRTQHRSALERFLQQAVDFYQDEEVVNTFAKEVTIVVTNRLIDFLKNKLVVPALDIATRSVRAKLSNKLAEVMSGKSTKRAVKLKRKHPPPGNGKPSNGRAASESGTTKAEPMNVDEASSLQDHEAKDETRPSASQSDKTAMSTPLKEEPMDVDHAIAPNLPSEERSADEEPMDVDGGQEATKQQPNEPSKPEETMNFGETCDTTAAFNGSHRPKKGTPGHLMRGSETKAHRRLTDDFFNRKSLRGHSLIEHLLKPEQQGTFRVIGGQLPALREYAVYSPKGLLAECLDRTASGCTIGPEFFQRILIAMEVKEVASLTQTAQKIASLFTKSSSSSAAQRALNAVNDTSLSNEDWKALHWIKENWGKIIAVGGSMAFVAFCPGAALTAARAAWPQVKSALIAQVVKWGGELLHNHVAPEAVRKYVDKIPQGQKDFLVDLVSGRLGGQKLREAAFGAAVGRTVDQIESAIYKNLPAPLKRMADKVPGFVKDLANSYLATKECKWLTKAVKSRVVRENARNTALRFALNTTTPKGVKLKVKPNAVDVYNLPGELMHFW